MSPFQHVLKKLSDHYLRRGINYSLDTIKASLEELGNPEKALTTIIHIAGTNGKGSTSAFIQAGLMASGSTVGLYTSPHLVTITERFKINNELISEKEFTAFYQRLTALSMYHRLSEFELLTLLAFLFFQARKPDYVILETGLGGRLDATNVIQNPLLTVITSIGRDHEDILGEGLHNIAREKAGIIKPDCPLVTFEQPAVVKQLFRIKARQNNAPLYEIPQQNQPYLENNRALALKSLELLLHKKILPGDTLHNAVKSTKIWGRFTRLNQFIIDGAHNPDSMQKLKQTLEAEFPNQTFTFVLGIQKIKPVKDMSAIIEPIVKRAYYIPFDPKLTHTTETFRQLVPFQIEELTLSELPELPADEPVIVTGSLYFIGKLKSLLLP